MGRHLAVGFSINLKGTEGLLLGSGDTDLRNGTNEVYGEQSRTRGSGCLHVPHPITPFDMDFT